MAKKIIKTKIHIIVLAIILLISYMISSYTITGAISSPVQIYKQVTYNNYNPSSTVANQVVNIKYKQHKLIDNYSSMVEYCFFDEDLSKKYLNTSFNNSMLFAAFTSMVMYFLCIALKSKRRELFEEPHFIHILILMNYIHRMDGEGSVKSMNHSFQS